MEVPLQSPDHSTYGIAIAIPVDESRSVVKEKGMLKLAVLASVLLLSVAAIGQNKDLNKPGDIRLLKSDFKQLNGQLDSVVVSEYVVDGSTLVLEEILIEDERAHAAEFRSRVGALQNCDDPTPLSYAQRTVGSQRYCTLGGAHVLLYTYGEKIYVISSKSKLVISTFTSGTLPLACHLHGAKDCVSMYY